MTEDMPRPQSWVCITVDGDKRFVHVREQGSRAVLGPFGSHLEAARRAHGEAMRLGIINRAA